MADVRELAGELLSWRRAGYMPSIFALQWRGVEIARLAWDGVFTSRATAFAGDFTWHIRRRGFRHLEVTTDAGDVVAEMHLQLFGSGELELAGGRRILFRRASLLPPAWTFQDEAGSPLVSVRGHLGSLWRGGDAVVEPAGATFPEALLVALLGIYVLIRRARRRARR